MRSRFSWSSWSITTKILVPFLALSVIAVVVVALVAIFDVRDLGDYALDTSSGLGISAIEDSTAHLTSLGETMIIQKAADVGRQVEMYLQNHPPMTVDEMRNDAVLRSIVVQPIGETGYTTLIDPVNGMIIIHRFPGQEKDIRPLESQLPSFWELIESSSGGEPAAGYYAWMEVDGSITEKYAGIQPVTTADGALLTLWATTYIEEFSRPADDTRLDIEQSIEESREVINASVQDAVRAFIIVLAAVIIIVTASALVLSRALTRPIRVLKSGAEEIGQGKLDTSLPVHGRDELGDLARTFNKMSADLKTYIDRLETTADENIAKEKTIQDNLRLYARKVSHAQEEERKRIARELHDETVQALVVVARHLEELAAGTSSLATEEIREQVRSITRGVRRFSQELRPSILDDLGLIPAVQWLCRDLSENWGIAVTSDVQGAVRPLPAETELTLFRIIQEALTNVRKHSGATEASVGVAYTDEGITVTVQDNGRGFTVKENGAEYHGTDKLGLLGMRERVELLNGEMTIDSAPGKGTVVTVIIPAQ